MDSEKIKLNLGCGNHYIDGFLNCDKSPLSKADVLFDLEETPWPIGSDSVIHILAAHSLEHVHKDRFPYVVREMYRVSADGARWMVYVPHGLTETYIKDPTHRMPFSYNTFSYFCDGTPEREMGILYGWGDIHLDIKLARPSGESIDYVIEVRK